MADECGEAWDGWPLQRSEAVAKVIPEADGLLGAGFHKPQESIAAIAAFIRTGSRGDLAARYLAANIVFRAVGVEWDVGALQHYQQFVFLCAESHKSLSRVTKPVSAEKIASKRRPSSLARREAGAWR